RGHGASCVAVARPAITRFGMGHMRGVRVLSAPGTGERAQRLPSIADYALLADCHGAALVARDGSIDWCCMPRFDTGSTFARLLDPEAGCCQIEVEGGGVDGRRYLAGTLVLESTL